MLKVDGTVWKRPWEEVSFYHQFKRSASSGWLKEGDEIVSIDSVKILDAEGESQNAVTVLDTAIQDQTKVVYRVGGGSPGTSYLGVIRIISSSGEKFEGRAELMVVA